MIRPISVAILLSVLASGVAPIVDLGHTGALCHTHFTGVQDDFPRRADGTCHGEDIGAAIITQGIVPITEPHWAKCWSSNHHGGHVHWPQRSNGSCAWQDNPYGYADAPQFSGPIEEYGKP